MGTADSVLIIVGTTVDTLKGYPVPGAGAMILTVEGNTAPGDGGGGQFYWDQLSVETDNGQTIIAPTGGGTGRWKRLTGLEEIEVPTIAALRALTSGLFSRVQVRAFSVEGDGGGGHFLKRLGSTTDNGGTIIVPTGITAFYYERQYSGPIDVRWFGAGQGNATADTAAIQAACNLFAATTGTTAGQVFFPYVSTGYKLNAKLTVNSNPNRSLQMIGEVGPGAGPPGITIGWYGADNTDTMVDFVGVNGLVVRNIAFDANPVAGSDNTKGCKYAVWLRPDTVNSVGASDITFEKCQFKNARNIAGAAQVALGPPSGSLTQTDNVRFRDCLFIGRPEGTSYLGDGIINLAANNTKIFSFDNCGFNYNRYGLNFALTSGPVTLLHCPINGSKMAAFLTADARITAIDCDCEGNNAICHYQGVGAVTGNLTLVNCEWFNYPFANPNPNGGSWDLQLDFPGEIRLEGGVYLNQRFLTVSAATNTSPIEITTATPHLLTTGDRMTVFGATGNTAANGFGTITVIDSTHFNIDGSTGNGSYTGSGQLAPEMKFRTFAQDVFAQNGAFHAQGVTFYGAEDYPAVFDTTGALLFDSTYAQAQDVRAAIVHCVGRNLTTDQPVPMPDIDMRAKRLGRYGAGYLTTDGEGNLAVARSASPTWSSQGIAATTSFGFSGSSADITLTSAWSQFDLTNSAGSHNANLLNTNATQGNVIEFSRTDDGVEDAILVKNQGGTTIYTLGQPAAASGRHWAKFVFNGSNWIFFTSSNPATFPA